MSVSLVGFLGRFPERREACRSHVKLGLHCTDEHCLSYVTTLGWHPSLRMSLLGECSLLGVLTSMPVIGLHTTEAELAYPSWLPFLT